ncbi:MAG: hypothetical protein F6K23_14505 [Okeania sp. SIO2C9]|uniref:hypothetical protein n=1 Tax=Okeania sp. SIO2C9 TaxID=2607791 RepID=UPI0013C1829E|nr:hypothetical protein [Okeania sp. SIO2C9]NEQ74143.1 hypothetical protein [Okeania sp. SIO2C9]
MSTLIGLLLLVVYGGGIWKFWNGFKQTNFSQNFQNRLVLSIFWPVLLIGNKSYRKNFTKALKGSRR